MGKSERAFNIETFVSKNLKTLRDKWGMSQEKFGALFGIKRQNYNAYERGTQMSIENLLSIVNYFDLDLYKFITLDMEFNEVSRTSSNPSGNGLESLPSLDSLVTEKQRYAYLYDLPNEKLINMVITLLKREEIFDKELIVCKNEIIKLQTDNLNFRVEAKSRDED